MAKLKINQQALDRFIKNELAPRLEEACADAALYVENVVAPVLTGRLASTSRAIEPTIQGNTIVSGIQLGGQSVYGVYSEQTFKREVSYGLAREVKNPYLRPAIPDVEKIIVDRLKQKRSQK